MNFSKVNFSILFHLKGLKPCLKLHYSNPRPKVRGN